MTETRRYDLPALDPSALADVETRLARITPGPWAWEDGPPTLYAGRGGFEHGLNLLGRLEPDANGPNNLDFIAAAPRDVRALLDAVHAYDALIHDRELDAASFVRQARSDAARKLREDAESYRRTARTLREAGSAREIVNHYLEEQTGG